MSTLHNDIQFTYRFLADFPLAKIDLFAVDGSNFQTRETDVELLREKASSVFTVNEYIYISIEKNQRLYFYLRLQSTSDNSKEYLQTFALSLKPMLEESLNYSESKTKPKNINMLNDFLVELLIRERSYQTANLEERAEMLHFNTKIPRMIILVDIIHFRQVVKKSGDKAQVQKKLDSILKILNDSISNYSEYAIYLYDDKFILFKDNFETIDDDLMQIRDRIQREVALNTQFITSRISHSLQNYKIEFDKINQLLSEYPFRSLDVPIYHIHDFQIELTLLNLCQDDRQFFCGTQYETLQKISENFPELIETLQVFFKNNMDTKKSASQMFIHRNTLYYRIRKLSQLLELDLYDSYNCTFTFLQFCMLQKQR